MPPRPQYSRQQRNFLVLEHHKRRGTRNCHTLLVRDYLAMFPGSRTPSKQAVRNMWRKQNELGTVNNCNSKVSPGDSHSHRELSELLLSSKQSREWWIGMLLKEEMIRMCLLWALQGEMFWELASPAGAESRETSSITHSKWLGGVAQRVFRQILCHC